MGYDQNEAKRRRQVDKPKTSTKHPYAATEHRVIDSEAYADLTFSARSLLVLITRQLSRDNNGHLQAAYIYASRFGFAKNTLSRALHELIEHGIIFRTRSGGYQQGAAQFAVTWLPIKHREGLCLQGFSPCAWRDWKPTQKKRRAPKLTHHRRKNGEWTSSPSAKFAPVPFPKIELTVYVPEKERKRDWIPADLDMLERRGLAGEQCFEIPPKVLQ